MKKIILLVLLITCNLTAVAAIDSRNYQIIYRISNYYDTSLRVRVDVETKHISPFIIINSRGSLSKTLTSRKPVYCAEDNRLIEYGRAQACSTVYWFIDIKRQPMDGINGAGQDDYYLNNGQWLITEGFNFPRFYGVSKALVCINNKTCQPLPEDDLPLFFIWGKQPTTIKLPSLTLNIFTDRQGDTLLDKQKLVKILEPRYQYIAKVFRANKSSPVNVIWLARNVNARVSGGLAGHRAFLANFYVENNKLVPNAEAALIHTSLHEYVHVATRYHFTTWVEESLAEYYAYKALTEGKLNDYALQRWQLAKSDSLFNAGLYKANQELLKGGVSSYTVLYVKGSAFWNEIDNQLAKHGDSLDQFIADLAEKNKDTKLPKAFIDKVTPIIGEDVLNQLVEQYLK